MVDRYNIKGWNDEQIESLADDGEWVRYTDHMATLEPWMLASFGPEVSADKIDRTHRFLEEALELVQVNGCTRDEAHQLVECVFGGPTSEPQADALSKHFAIYSVEEDENHIRLSVCGQQVACWHVDTAQGTALLKFEAERQSAQITGGSNE